jgi:hypothetical protein
VNGWYVKRDGQKYGPYTSTQLVEMARKGQVLPVDWVARGDNDNWIPATQVKGLFPAQATTAPPPLPVGDAQPDEETNRPIRRRATPASQLPLLLVAAGGGCLVLVVVVVIALAVGSGGSTPGKKGRSSTSGRGGESLAERAFAATGAKKDPSFKPAAPGSRQDFCDAVNVLAERLANVPIRSGGKAMCYVPDPGIESKVWHQIFGEPQRLSRGRERIGRVENEFDRWRHSCTDGVITLHGKIVTFNGKTYYNPRSLNFD